MQYCNTLDDYESLMLKNNAGDYPCSWLLGDMNTNEIMILELGLNHHNKKITKNGIYYGMNSVMDPKMRVLETNDISHKDNNESKAKYKQSLDQAVIANENNITNNFTKFIKLFTNITSCF